MKAHSTISEVRALLLEDRHRVKARDIAWDVADAMGVITPFLRDQTVDVDALRSSLAIMTELCRLKYGNVDKDVNAEIEKAEALLAATSESAPG